jgi:hypothetical protein
MDGGGKVNPRGYTPLRVCGREVALVPTNRAVQQIEVRLGIGLPALLARLMADDIRVRDLNVIVEECLKGAGFSGKDGSGAMFDYDEIGEDILRNLSTYTLAVGAVLGGAFGNAGPKAEPPPSAAGSSQPSP